MTDILELYTELDDSIEEPEDVCGVGGSVTVLTLFSGFRIIRNRPRPCQRLAAYLAMFPCGDTMLMCAHHHDTLTVTPTVITCKHDHDYWPHEMSWVRI